MTAANKLEGGIPEASVSASARVRVHYVTRQKSASMTTGNNAYYNCSSHIRKAVGARTKCY